MEVIIIAAVARNLVIGKDNDLVWHLPTDMRFFKETTMDTAVLMGRRNYDSIPERFRPLPKRRNIVVSRQEGLDLGEGVPVFQTIEEGIAHAESEGEEKLFIIGGGQIYDYVLKNDLADRMYLTWIDEDFKGDTFFPAFEESDWKTSTLFRNRADDENPYDFRIVEYWRKVTSD